MMAFWGGFMPQDSTATQTDVHASRGWITDTLYDLAVQWWPMILLDEDGYTADAVNCLEQHP